MRLLLVAAAAAGLIVSGCALRDDAARPLTYVALGASDAVGVGAAHPETEGWVPLFGAKLGASTRTVNLGVSGSTLGQALQEQLGPALDARPDVITVWLAVNDLNAGVSLQSYAADLDALLGKFETSNARVLVGNVPDLARLAAYRGQDPTPLQSQVARWNAVIAATAARHGATLVDLYSQWQEVAEHPEYLSADGFHPSADGYQALADVFAAAL